MHLLFWIEPERRLSRLSVRGQGRILNSIANVEHEMEENWEKQLACAIGCQRCGQPLQKKDQRLLSVYDHQPICMSCKAAEEKRPDFEDVSRMMITECMEKTNKPYGDPASYCFHHFCPFKCK